MPTECPFNIDSLVGDNFPENVVLIYFPGVDKHQCYCHNKIHGLASFSTTEKAENFLDMYSTFKYVFEEVTFDEAREVAKGKPAPIVCLFLLDDVENPAIHYVK
jgi:hypothetical protein